MINLQINYSISNVDISSGTATPSHAKTSNFAEMPEVSKMQEVPRKKELEVPQVAICPATPQVTFLRSLKIRNGLFSGRAYLNFVKNEDWKKRTDTFYRFKIEND